jgi:hypothetical protein
MRAGAYATDVSQLATLVVENDGARVELRAVDGRRVHVLQDRPLSRGDEIELLLGDGYWLHGHYEWSGIEARWPGLRVDLGGPWQRVPVEDRPPAAVLALHPDAILRWPSR